MPRARDVVGGAQLLGALRRGASRAAVGLVTAPVRAVGAAQRAAAARRSKVPPDGPLAIQWKPLEVGRSEASAAASAQSERAGESSANTGVYNGKSSVHDARAEREGGTADTERAAATAGSREVSVKRCDGSGAPSAALSDDVDAAEAAQRPTTIATADAEASAAACRAAILSRRRAALSRLAQRVSAQAREPRTPPGRTHTPPPAPAPMISPIAPDAWHVALDELRDAEPAAAPAATQVAAEPTAVSAGHAAAARATIATAAPPTLAEPSIATSTEPSAELPAVQFEAQSAEESVTLVTAAYTPRALVASLCTATATAPIAPIANPTIEPEPIAESSIAESSIAKRIAEPVADPNAEDFIAEELIAETIANPAFESKSVAYPTVEPIAEPIAASIVFEEHVPAAATLRAEAVEAKLADALRALAALRQARLDEAEERVRLRWENARLRLAAETASVSQGRRQRSTPLARRLRTTATSLAETRSAHRTPLSAPPQIHGDVDGDVTCDPNASASPQCSLRGGRRQGARYERALHALRRIGSGRRRIVGLDGGRVGPCDPVRGLSGFELSTEEHSAMANSNMSAAACSPAPDSDPGTPSDELERSPSPSPGLTITPLTKRLDAVASHDAAGAIPPAPPRSADAAVQTEPQESQRERARRLVGASPAVGRPPAPLAFKALQVRHDARLKSRT